MAKIYFYKYTTVAPFDENKTVQYGGIVAANSYTDAMKILENMEIAPATGKCDIVSIDYLEETGDSILWTDDLELYAKLYKEMM